MAEIGTVSVPVQIAVNAGKPAFPIATAVTEITVKVLGVPSPLGAQSVSMKLDAAGLRPAVARALREMADEIENEDTVPISTGIWADREHSLHELVQHRDGKEPWCKGCGLNAAGQPPSARRRAGKASQDT
ncbi:hypothetical protein [Mycetocola saprophilus]|uniref:hypothetical protein n=1 Tax=Mycetocola saprophilus TaxID=76636 RepID=UPI0004C1E286|nr:hypothetical protein [Mycetocola saprophilus]